ncbi:hypothetical protein [uncultured Acetobacteroides sp.]|uniref:hypothetical protein n=1 Tax=uncultured Acetobacteroides sp. TaxID=1760811 RepID=UPI0029F59978|nr:hypothetical protein [uncultured Acetobacteroides sp.]
MQEEIKKHGKKIFTIAAESNAGITRKMKEILLEIFIIFIAVSISVWFHNYNEKRHQDAEVKEFLIDLKDDLLKDKTTYQRHVGFFNEDSQLYQKILSINKSNIDTMNIKIMFNVRTLSLSCGNYEGFKTSGKIGYIKNKKLKKLLLGYYENEVKSLTFAQDYYMQQSSALFSSIFDKTTNTDEYLCSKKVKWMARANLGIASSVKEELNYDIKLIDQLLKEIAKDTAE